MAHDEGEFWSTCWLADMRVDLETLERILLDVRKPGRYVGGEFNAVVKDWDAIGVRVCLAFPDIYDLGMSNLGLAILYDILNGLPDVLAERSYLPWVDMIAAMRGASIPLYSLESKRSLDEFDVIGFSLPQESHYTNLLEMLDLARLPVLAADRDEGHPLVIAGGHAVFNPEPVASFVDAFVVGDGEDAIVELVQAVRDVGKEEREVQLRALAGVSGVYVPRFYDVRYRADGTIGTIEPNLPGAPQPILKRVVAVLPPPPTRLVVPNVDIAHNRGTIEIQRGCTRGCRFCQAGAVTRPVRERPVDEVVEAAGEMVRQTGFEELGLLSLSSSDYTNVESLVQTLVERFGGEHLSISLPALRADSFSLALTEAIAQGRRTGFTFAPEVGTERLRGVINKRITVEQVMAVAQGVFERGWRTVKLYFMIGVPGEQMGDVDAIVDLVRSVHIVGRKIHGRKATVNVSVNTFVPKPHTPFQWVGMESVTSIREKQSLLRRELRGRGLKLSYSDMEVSVLEGALARGDRRLGDVILRAWELGARFDAWDEGKNLSAWARAFGELGLNPEFYACRERADDEVFPWEIVSAGVHRHFLFEEFERSKKQQTLVDCREQCHACGILANFATAWSNEWCCPGGGSTRSG